MPTPEFILRLREKIGTDPLWLSGAAAVVVRGDEVLVVKRADNGQWEPVAGIIEPGEHPAETAEREVAEEAGVEVRAERIAGIDVTDVIEYSNGDRSQFLLVVMRCRWIAGDPRPVDGEATEARWVRIADLDALDPPLEASKRRRLEWGLEPDGPAVFGGSGDSSTW